MATHDYVIANDTGANVRTDLNNVLQAILTNNSNGSSPSTTAAYMLWADTSAGTLKIRNSANNAWVELFQLDGTLTLEDGSESTPGLAFRDDLDTGIFSGGANEINITTNGTERFVINSSGNVGIGTDSPDQKCHIHKGSSGSVSSDSNTVLTLENSNHAILSFLAPASKSCRINFGDPDDNNNGMIIYNHAASSPTLNFEIDTSEVMRIVDQKIGINVTGPASTLEVRSPNNTGIISRCESTQSNDTAKGFSIRNNSATDTISMSFLGNITCVALTQTSDITLKENIQPLTNVLDKVKQLTGYKFNFKNHSNKTMGVMAQDVEKVFPEIVYEEGGKKTLAYSGLIGALVESVKELSSKVEALESA